MPYFLQTSALAAVVLLATACENQTKIQRDYVSDRNNCQYFAEDHIDYFIPPGEQIGVRERNAKLVTLFSDCMYGQGWTVATPEREGEGEDDDGDGVPDGPPKEEEVASNNDLRDLNDQVQAGRATARPAPQEEALLQQQQQLMQQQQQVAQQQQQAAWQQQQLAQEQMRLMQQQRTAEVQQSRQAPPAQQGQQAGQGQSDVNRQTQAQLEAIEARLKLLQEQEELLLKRNRQLQQEMQLLQERQRQLPYHYPYPQPQNMPATGLPQRRVPVYQHYRHAPGMMAQPPSDMTPARSYLQQQPIAPGAPSGIDALDP